MSAKGVVRQGKEFDLFISNEDMNYIIKIIKLLQDLGVLIDGATQIVKHEIRKQEGRVIGPLLAPLGTFISATNNFFSSKIYKWKKWGVLRAGKGYIAKQF